MAGYLELNAATEQALTVDKAALDITGDIEIVWCGELTDWSPDTSGFNDVTLVAKRTTASTFNQAYVLNLFNGAGVDYVPRLYWTESTPTDRTATGTVDVTTVKTGDHLWIKATLDVDNGAGTPQYEVKFWYSNDAVDTAPASVSWTQWGITITGTTGVSNIRNSASDLVVGEGNASFGSFRGNVYYADVKNGIGGTIVANPDFRDDTQGWSSPPGTDDNSNSWALNNGATWISDALTVTLYATSDGTISSVVNELDTTTNLYQSVDDDPATPSDSDYINNTITPASVFFGLTDMPTDFGNMDTLSITFRLATANYASNVSLYAQIFQSDESTSMSNEMLIETVTGNAGFANDAEVVFTGLNTTAGKSTWDAAKVRLRWA